MAAFGKLLMIMGGLLLLVGAVLWLTPSIPWLGHLPGDFSWRGKNVTIYAPLATSLLISLLLTIILNLLFR